MIDFVLDYSKEIGLIFFFAVFMSLIIWLLIPSNAKRLEQQKFIPLTDDSNGDNNGKSEK